MHLISGAAGSSLIILPPFSLFSTSFGNCLGCWHRVFSGAAALFHASNSSCDGGWVHACRRRECYLWAWMGKKILKISRKPWFWCVCVWWWWGGGIISSLAGASAAALKAAVKAWCGSWSYDSSVFYAFKKTSALNSFLLCRCLGWSSAWRMFCKNKKLLSNKDVCPWGVRNISARRQTREKHRK